MITSSRIEVEKIEELLKRSGLKKRCQTACKPGSVPPSWAVDGHSSGTPVAERLVRPTRAAARRLAWHPGSSRGARRSYLVLLPVGFSLPLPLPAARCALAAPFTLPRRDARTGRVTFCGTFLGSPRPGVTRRPCLRGAGFPLAIAERPIRPSWRPWSLGAVRRAVQKPVLPLCRLQGERGRGRSPRRRQGEVVVAAARVGVNPHPQPDPLRPRGRREDRAGPARGRGRARGCRRRSKNLDGSAEHRASPSAKTPISTTVDRLAQSAMIGVAARPAGDAVGKQVPVRPPPRRRAR